MELIADRNRFRDLRRLFDFLATWEERPTSLTPMAYEWCSAICEAAGQLGLAGARTSQEIRSPAPLSGGFSQSGNRGPPRLKNGSRIRGCLPGSALGEYLDFETPLKVAFRLVGPPNDWLPTVHLNHTFHDGQVFEAAFSSDNDEIIADATCAWVAWSPKLTRSCARYFAERVRNPRPFSRRLRAVAIHAIGGHKPLLRTLPDLRVVHLLNRLNACKGDSIVARRWYELLKDVIRSPVGKNLSSHYWRLLDELQFEGCAFEFEMRDVEVMREFEEVGDWEKLEVWIAVVWWSLPASKVTPELVGVLGDAILKLIPLRPSALQRFETLSKRALPAKARLIEVLDQARVGRLALEAHRPLYVSVRYSPFSLF